MFILQIAWYISVQVIKIFADSGRGVRPVFIVNNSKILLTQDHLRKLSDPSIQYNWYHLNCWFNKYRSSSIC